MPALRIAFLVHGAVAALFGLFFVLAAGMAIGSFDLGEPTLPALLFARSAGIALLGLALINLMSPGDIAAPAVCGVAIANILVHLGSIAVDFSESYARNPGVWVGLSIHLIFAALFAYFLLFRRS